MKRFRPGDAARAELEQTPGVVEVADYILYDEELQNQIASALDEKDLGHINVLIEHGLAVLSGEVADGPVSPKDILATTYHLAGLDPHTLIHDRFGQPRPVGGDGRVLAEVLA